MSRVSAWPRPAAVLLDFGGVLVESRRRPAGVAELAIQVSAMLATRDVPAPDVSTIDSDIAAGLDAWRRWKTARSRESAPRELSHQEFWARFVAASWSEPARRVVVDAAFELCRSLVDRTAIRSPKPGASELLDAARAIGARTGIVSNALSGAVHRELVDRFGFRSGIDVERYSDEVGIRKPNPKLIVDAATALGVPVEACWYVGDQHDRDVLCGRRAGVGVTVLVRDHPNEVVRRRVHPDLEVTSLLEIVDALGGRPALEVPA